MNIKQLILGAMPLALLASCSNDDIVNNGNQTEVSGDGKYMSVSINLPTVPATRADNDNYDDGTPNEYKIFSGCLVIFKGANEETATFGAAYDLQALNPDLDNDNDNITETILKSVQLKDFTYNETDNLYAFVMLNYNNVAEVDNNNGLKLNTKEGKVTLDKGTTKFADVFYKITNSKFYEGEGTGAYNFFMCNAPLSPNEGGSTNPEQVTIHMLSLLDKSKIKDTKAEAEKDENCAGSIYVERAVAKAQLKWEPKEFSNGSTVGTLDKQKPTFTFIGWALDVTEPESYIARKVDGADWWGFTSSKLTTPNYRFVGNTKIGTTKSQPEANLYRTYWCYDPHYKTDIYETSANFPQLTDDSFKENTNPLYCYENTFDVAHMNYKNTTRAVFQVHVGFGEGATTSQTFYVLDGKEDEIYTSLEDVESYPRNTIIGSYIIETQLREALKAGESLSTEEIEKIVDITFTRSAATGIRSVTDITIKKKSGMDDTLADKFEKDPELSESDKKILMSNANSYEITEFESGKMYYEVRFMHFGSPDKNKDLTPWETDKDNVTSTEEAYDNNATDYLGRWGMVRNNWYDLTVTAVRKLGSPVIPDANVEKSDDNNEKEQHIAFKINVLSWAKRTQNIEF